MYRMIQYLLRCIFLLFGVNLLSVAEVRAQCNLQMDVSYSPVQQLSLADIDFEHFESKALLFTVIIRNSTGRDSAQLHITLDIHLADGSRFDNALDFLSSKFPVPLTGKIITNIDLSGGNLKQGFTLDERAKNAVQDVALATGKFPAGKYIFNFELTNCTQAGIKKVEIDIQNISRVDLRSPRDGETTNEFPFFEFFHEGNKAILMVAEKSLQQTREDAISHEPLINRVELVGQNSFLYSGGRPLEQGKTYVWKVISKSLGPGSSNLEVSSPIWQFTVSSSSQEGPEDTILKQLEEIFGHRYGSIFELIRNGGFKLTGSYQLNGAPLSQGELVNILNELRELADSVEMKFE